MGAAPSTPSAAQQQELEETKEEAIRRAAAAIAQSDVLLLLTGAGWSADSGLSVYKDVADVAAYRERDLTYSDICEPRWLEDDKELFYGFWGKCFNDYRDTAEHEGYHIVKGWRDRLFQDTPTCRALAARHGGEAQAFYSFTSNVDAHHLRVFSEHEVRECHGNSETWQCSDRECHAQHSNTPSRWAAPGDFRFAVHAETQNAVDGAPAKPARLSDGPRGFTGNHPKCPRCGQGLRPSILMFSDSNWIDNSEQKDKWHRWQSAVEEQTTAQNDDATVRPLRVAILEVGAGGNVTTIRKLAENTVEAIRDKGGVPTLIRVNPDLPLADSNHLQSATISIASYGLAAIREIDEEMDTLRKHSSGAVETAESSPLVLKTVPVEETDEGQSPRAYTGGIGGAKMNSQRSDELVVKPGEVAPSTAEQLEKMRETFDAIDADGSGTLDRDEVNRAAMQLGRFFIGSELDDAMNAMDLDGNGEVEFEEFCAWWEAGGKLSASERFELKWAQFGARFDSVLSSALGASGIR